MSGERTQVRRVSPSAQPISRNLDRKADARARVADATGESLGLRSRGTLQTYSFGELPVRSANERQYAPPRTNITVVEHHRQPFSASIRRSGGGVGTALTSKPETEKAAPTGGDFIERYRDAMPGNEQTTPVDISSVLAQTRAQPVEDSGQPLTGHAMRLPDIVFDQPIRETDAIGSALSYAPTVTQSGTAAPFGETLPYTFTLSGISITNAGSKFTVNATIDNPVTFQVASGGDTDIASATDPAITQANYATVASDLTPDMADLKGRPPRTQFWAQDFTIKHEKFHASEGILHSRLGVIQAQTWLNGKTASSEGEVTGLLNQVPAKVIATRSAAMTFPGREERAYTDGAPSYRARATAIKTKGDARGYVPTVPPAHAP
jgi:hypothetical protein